MSKKPSGSAQIDSIKIKRYSLNDHFTVISNESVEDPNISWAAKGLLCYILSRPSDWCIYVTQLAKIYMGNSQRGNGIEAIYSMLKELKECGYVKFVKERNAKGQWNSWYEAYPVPQDFKIIFPHRVEPDLESPDLVKDDTITSNDNTKKLKNNNPASPEQAPSAVVVSLDKLQISDSLKRKISKDYSVVEIDIAVDRCLTWKTKKSHAAAIRYLLSNSGEWEDNSAEKQIEENKKYINYLRRYDGEIHNGIQLAVGHMYVEFSGGMKTTTFKIEEPDFILNVKAFLEKITGKVKK